MGMLWMILPCIVDGRALAMAPLVLTNLAPVVSLSSSMLKSLLPSLLRVSPSMLKSFLRAIFPCWNDAQISLRFCGVIAAGGAAAARPSARRHTGGPLKATHPFHRAAGPRIIG